MINVAYEAALCVPDAPASVSEKFSSGSTDLGDLCSIMPVVHPYAPGAVGTSHGSDYYIEKPELACVGSAKMQINMLDILLKNGAERASKIVAEYKPQFANKDEYFKYIDELTSTGYRITYNEDDTATIKL